MFGFVMANTKELSKEENARYNRIYCGICRQIRLQSSSLCRFGLQYDLAFLALLLTSLYEPREKSGKRACGFHPLRPRPWVENRYIRYCADMNVVLSYYKALDDYRDGHGFLSQTAMNIFGKNLDDIIAQYPRQCKAIDEYTRQLAQMEKYKESNPDEPANCFGKLMAELFVYEEDNWSDTLREMGMALGRFIYLADAAIDYRTDLKKKQYNPFIAMGTGEDWARWEQYLVLDMGRCTDYYERLPLVQDKKILDNILYSGVWLAYRQRQRGEKKHD